MTNIEAARLIVELYGIASHYGYSDIDNYTTAVAMACRALALAKFYAESTEDIPTIEVQLD